MYVKCYSEEHEAHYYLDSRDNSVSWSPPALLFREDGTIDETIKVGERGWEEVREGAPLVVPLRPLRCVSEQSGARGLGARCRGAMRAAGRRTSASSA